MKKNSIKTVDALEKEIYKRKLRLKEIEKTLGQNVDQLRDNFGSMALQTILGPGKSSSMGITGTLMMKVLDNERLQSSLAEKIGDGIYKVTDKILHK
jgi:hypothetical protein